MKVIDLYAYYRALVRYFRDNEPYEVKAINAESFKYNPDLPKWEQLAGMRDASSYVLANILERNWEIKDFNKQSYLDWCAVNESLFYVFTTEVEKLLTRPPSFSLLKIRYDFKISRETIIVLDELFNNHMIEKWVNSSDDMERAEAILLKKYAPMVLFRIAFLEKYKTALEKIKADA